MYFQKHILFLWFVFSTLLSCSQEKINGVNIVSPPQPTTAQKFAEIKQINAHWVSLIPYAFSQKGSPKIQFDTKWQWWGEKTDGIITMITQAQKEGFKIMLKPHIWYTETGWIGDFRLTNEKDWEIWEKEYTDYILTCAKIAQDKKVSIFCLGTELKYVVLNRPDFLENLIKEIKKIYIGKLTYAANWDNYKNVTFWNDLDYIGIDAYFPLSNEKSPTVIELNKAWRPVKEDIKNLSRRINKPVLFTEYGFESSDYNTKETWGTQGKYAPNHLAQVNAYQSFYETFYHENWFAGGFLWKWHLTERTMRKKATSFTPQGKETLEVIKDRFNN